MLKGHAFGLVNGIIMILSIIVGLYATKVTKIGIIGAIIALIISDPLSGALGIYVAEKEDNPDNAHKVGKDAFLAQTLLQVGFLLIIILCPTVTMGVVCSIIVGILIVIVYGIHKNLKAKKTIVNLLVILALIIVTYASDRGAYYLSKRKS